MGRWADAFQACTRTRDTVDTADTSSAELSSAGRSVSSVNSVTPLAAPSEGLLDQLAEHVSTVSAVTDPKRTPPPAPYGRFEPIVSQSSSEAAYARTPVQRPVSWADPMDSPTPGNFCSCCRSRRWWCEARKPTGWCCWTCHPPDHLAPEQVVEVRTCSQGGKVGTTALPAGDGEPDPVARKKLQGLRVNTMQRPS
jgi:hypothetical protein